LIGRPWQKVTQRAILIHWVAAVRLKALKCARL
jgi:hypothetical protein